VFPSQNRDLGTIHDVGRDIKTLDSPLINIFLESIPLDFKREFKNMVDNPVNKSNIQGGIWPRMPKEFESYLFYKITDVNRFRNQLRGFIGNITTGLECEVLLSKIDTAEQNGMATKIPVSGMNVAFTQKGLEKVWFLLYNALDSTAGKEHHANNKLLRKAGQSRDR